ncbi:RNA-directed DNA polymerase, eukaryota, reverse transcriptase zinc-binding domain protein [Tanacetum coccineum]
MINNGNKLYIYKYTSQLLDLSGLEVKLFIHRVCLYWEWNVVFFSQKRSGGGRGVKEKNLNRALNNETVKDVVVSSVTVASGINNGDSTRKGLSFRTLIISAGNEADVVVPLESIRVINERFINTGMSSYARVMIEIQVDMELKDTIVVAMSKLVGERFYTCTIRVEYEWNPPRCGFQQVNKKKDAESRKKNVGFSSTTTTIVEKIDKIEKLIIDGKIILVNDEGKPLEKVDYPGDHDSEDEVELVDNKMASFLALEKVGYGSNSLLEQWRKTYENVDYDYDPYDDDIYEDQEIPEKIQSICDNLDIKLRGREDDNNFGTEGVVHFFEDGGLAVIVMVCGQPVIATTAAAEAVWVLVEGENLYGHHGGIFEGPMQRLSLSPWCGILSYVNSLKLKGIDLLSLCIRKLGNGVSIRFWDEAWCGSLPLKTLFPRIYMLNIFRDCNIANRISLQDWNYVLRRIPRGGIEATQLADLQSLIGDVVLSDHNDSWKWPLDVTKGFPVASARSLIDSHILELPSRVNLDRRGIDVHSILCPIFHDDVETVNHIFFSCEVAFDLWPLLAKWWEFDIPFCANMTDWISWLDTSSFSNKEGVAIGLHCFSIVYVDLL